MRFFRLICRTPGRQRPERGQTMPDRRLYDGPGADLFGRVNQGHPMCVRILVSKAFRLDGAGRIALPSRRVGDVAPVLFRGGWGPIEAAWSPQIDDFRSDFRGSVGAKNLTLSDLFSP
jgi:hypothetical protein